MPFDGSAVDAALIARLRGDATLAAMLPDGAYIDEAPPDATRFVTVSLVESVDVATFEGRAIESILYLVLARALSTAGADVKAAAARIDALLEDQYFALDGAGLMEIHREARVRSTEVDEVDPDIRWQHRGGRYRVMVSLSSESSSPWPPRWVDVGWIDN